MYMYYKLLWKESNTCSISKLKPILFFFLCIVKRQGLNENGKCALLCAADAIGDLKINTQNDHIVVYTILFI